MTLSFVGYPYYFPAYGYGGFGFGLLIVLLVLLLVLGGFYYFT
nr:sporulation protein YjcZ [Melghiribacillus thermohalophilus]